MKTIIAATCFLCFSFISIAQNIPTDTSAPVVAYWLLGEKKLVRITKTVEKTKAGKRESFANSNYEAAITVRDSVKEGYTMEWKYTSFGSSEGYLQSLPELHTLLKNLTIVYKTDDVGSFLELVNYPEVKKLVDASISSLSNITTDTNAVFRDAVKEMKTIFQSRESIEQLVLRDISLFHTPFGIEYSLLNQVQEAEIVNFLGGDPWPATLSFQLTSLKPEQDLIQVTIGQTIDEVKAAAILKDFFSKISAKSGNKIKEGEFPSYISIKDHHEFDIILSTGWIKRAYLKRIVQTDGVKKTETMDISIK